MPGRGRETLSGYALSRHLIIGFVLDDAVANPVIIGLPDFRTAPCGEGDSEKVGKTIAPIVHILGRIQQNLDQLFPLLWITTGQELPNSPGRGQRPRYIQRNPA